MGDDVFASAAVGSGGEVYVGSNADRLFALTSAGTLSWSYQAAEYFRSSPALAADGRLIVGSGDNNLYCLGPTPTPTPTVTPTATSTPTATPPIDLTANKTTFATRDRIIVTADVWPLPVPCYPFVRVVMADHSVLYYVLGTGFTTAPTPYLGFEAGTVQMSLALLHFPVLDAQFGPIPTGRYVLEGGAVDMTRTTSADNLIYYGRVDEEELTVN